MNIWVTMHPRPHLVLPITSCQQMHQQDQARENLQLISCLLVILSVYRNIYQFITHSWSIITIIYDCYFSPRYS